DPGPAQISWTHSAGAHDVYSIDGAVSYNYEVEALRGQQLWGLDMQGSVVPSFEAHTSNDSKNKEDTLKAKLDLQFALDAPGTVHGLSLAPTYETDRTNRTETYGGEIFYSPTWTAIPGLGVFRSFRSGDVLAAPPSTPEEGARLAYPGFAWQPSVGFEA